MYCPFCGTDNPDERKFCLACGTPLEGAAKSVETAAEKKQQRELRLKIVREQEPETSKVKELKLPAEQNKNDQAPVGNGKHSIGRIQQVPVETPEAPEEEKHELYKQVLATPKIPADAQVSIEPLESPEEEKHELYKQVPTPPQISESSAAQASQPPALQTEAKPLIQPVTVSAVSSQAHEVGEQSITKALPASEAPVAEQKQVKVEIKNEDHGFEPEQTVGLKRGVLLGEEDYFETQPQDKNSLRKSNIRIMAIMALTWISLVSILSFTYLAFSQPETGTPTQPVNQFEILTEISDFKARGEQQALKLSWVPAANPVKIVDQLLEIYDLDGNLVKELNIGPEAFAYNLSGLEPGQKYRLTLKLKAADGRESGGSSLIVTFPSDFDKQRKQDLAELKEALEIYKSKHGKYPASRNFASLLNTLIQDKILKRRIKDPEYPEHSYEYKMIWEGAGYELKIYLGNPADELFEGELSPNQIYTYTPFGEKTAAEAVLEQAQETQESSEQEY